MDSSRPPNQNDRLGTIFKWGLGTLIVWNLLSPETRDSLGRSLQQVAGGMTAAARQRQQMALEKQRIIREAIATPLPALPMPALDFGQLGSTAATAGVRSNQVPAPLTGAVVATTSGSLTKKPLEADAAWRKHIMHPSVVLILGKRGSGKSVLAYRILELFRYGPALYVVGVPATARNLLPDWIGIVPTLEDVPPKAMALVDEAYLRYHARGSMARESKSMSQLLNLSRQREQSLIFVSQEARQVDRNIASSANTVIFKDTGILQLEFDRPELTKLATQAKEAFAAITGDRRGWSFVFSPDSDFSGLLGNELPSFWKPSLSCLFAVDSPPAKSRPPERLTAQQKAQRAKELRAHGASYAEIAQVLGVTRGTVLNYLRDYPYR